MKNTSLLSEPRCISKGIMPLDFLQTSLPSILFSSFLIFTLCVSYFLFGINLAHAERSSTSANKTINIHSSRYKVKRTRTPIETVVVDPAPVPVPEETVVVDPAPVPVPEETVVVDPAPVPVPEETVIVDPSPVPVPEETVVVDPIPEPDPEESSGNTSQICEPVEGSNNLYVDVASICGQCSDTRERHHITLLTPWCSISKASQHVQPGDTVYVQSGIYREQVSLSLSGTESAPISFIAYPGSTPILTGAEPLNGWKLCASLEECGGNPHWENIYHTIIPENIAVLKTNLHQDDKMLWIAQEPNLSDPFFTTNIFDYYTTPPSNVTETSLIDSILYQSNPAAWNDTWVLLWVSHNRVLFNKILEFIPSENKILFDDGGNPPYTDRDTKFSLYNGLSLLDQPGEYSVSVNADTDGNKKIYLWPLDNSSIETSKIELSFRNYGININNQSYITIEGFTIQNHAGSNLTDGSGIGTVNRNQSVSNIVIRNNIIKNNRHTSNGYGAIFLDKCSQCIVENNSIINNPNHYGIFMSSGSSNAKIHNNTISKPGYGAIVLFGQKDSSIIANNISGVKGSHSNTITVYLSSDNILIADNIISNSSASLTISDSSNITFYNNVIEASLTSGTVIDEWKSDMSGTIRFINNTFVKSLSHTSLNIANNLVPQYIMKNNIIDGGGVSNRIVRTHNLYIGLTWNQDIKDGWIIGEGEIIDKNVVNIFEDYDSSNYTLPSLSSAKNSGTNIYSWLPIEQFPEYDFYKDILGVSRNVDKPSMGAYE